MRVSTRTMVPGVMNMGTLMRRPVSSVAGLLPPEAVSAAEGRRGLDHRQLNVGGEVNVDGRTLVEHHLDDHVLFQVLQRAGKLFLGQVVLFETLLVQEVVVGAVGVQVLGVAVVYFGDGKVGVVPLEGALDHGPG